MSKSDLINQDINTIIADSKLFDLFRNSSILITGATGLIGSMLVKTLCKANLKYSLNIKIIGLVRNIEKANNTFSDFINEDMLTFICNDITSDIDITGNIDYIIHAASPTSSKYFVTNPVETITTAIDGTRNILELAKNHKVKSMVYLSSLEVYGTPSTENGIVGEADYGYIDPTNIRSSYSEGKRLIECLCSSYCCEYDVPVKIARLSQTFGPGVDYNDGRVFAEFARCIIEKRDIVLHTPGNTVRNYCYISDAVNAILYILLKGTSGSAYNVANEDTAISIKDMAKLVCSLYPERNVNVIFDCPDNLNSFGYNPEMVIRLNCNRLTELGWSAKHNLDSMFTRLISSMETI